MKVVMIAPDCYVIDRRIILEAKSLVKAGHTVVLLSGFECPKEEHYNLEGIEIHRYIYDWDDERLKKIRKKLPNNDNVIMAVNHIFLFMARKLFEINPFEQFMISKLLEFNADIIQVHDFPCLKVGVHAARQLKVPLIYDAHEIYYSQECLPKKIQNLYFKIEKKYIKYANAVITVNPFFADILAKNYNIEKPNVIMNCTELPLNFNKNNKTLLREKGGIPDDWNVVLYQGWISSERNIENIIKAVKYFPDKTCLAFIGYGAHENVLKELSVSENVEHNVFFLGLIDNDEMLNYTTGADIGIIPYLPIDDNHIFCSPNKLFEYVLVGLPIITNKLPFFELLQEKYGFIITTDMASPEKIGQEVTRIMEDKQIIPDLKSKCDNAAKDLNWDVEGKKLISIYQSVFTK